MTQNILQINFDVKSTWWDNICLLYKIGRI